MRYPRAPKTVHPALESLKQRPEAGRCNSRMASEGVEAAHQQPRH